MSAIRVCDNDLVLLSGRLAESVAALTHLEAELEADSVESGEIVREIGRLSKIEDGLDDMITDSSPAVIRPPWADGVRLQMVRQTIETVLDTANRAPVWRDQGFPGDLELVLQLIDMFSGLDTSESLK
jgi:hypothetical protein